MNPPGTSLLLPTTALPGAAPSATSNLTSGPAPVSLRQIPEGRYTYTLYSFIRDGRFQDVIRILQNELTSFPKSRALLSLLGYCYYQAQEFASAADCYEQLVRHFPEVDDYRLHYAQSLHKSGQYQAAQKACLTIENPELARKVLKLQAAIKYEMDDLAGCKLLIEQAPADDTDSIINQGCLLFKEDKYEEACIRFAEALKILGYSAELSYNIALCHYRMGQYVPALKHIADIIERGIRDHPELSVGMATEGIEVRSVGNSQTLHETFLVEAFNLKAAIEYQLKNYEAAREALTDMPPRLEQELDHVTLHNVALMNMDDDPTGGFEKLNFLLQQQQQMAAVASAGGATTASSYGGPPETFANLLLLYIKYEYFDLAADLLAENQGLAYATLNSYLYEFIEATLLRQSSPEEAYKKFDDLANKHVDALRKLTKTVQEARQNHDEDVVKSAVHEYDEAVERYIPVLMAQAKIYWDLENYLAVEKIFRKSVEFCNEHDVWKLNVAHVLFMQETKYKEAISFYEPIVKKQYDSILDVTAIVLANLCVSYIMTSQNEEAEELMRRIEKEEERIASMYNFDGDPSNPNNPNNPNGAGAGAGGPGPNGAVGGPKMARTYHLCIVNLVIGTLYCAKGNYEFGISRIMKSLEPFNKKLCTDTWYYAKRCFVSLFETLAKHMILLKDAVFAEILQFFDNCEMYGRNIPVIVDAIASSSATTHPNAAGGGGGA
ncbi:Tetratricopeptide repeat protein 30A, partial [Quaeritorhiza haematococci]